MYGVLRSPHGACKCGTDNSGCRNFSDALSLSASPLFFFLLFFFYFFSLFLFFSFLFFPFLNWEAKKKEKEKRKKRGGRIRSSFGFYSLLFLFSEL